MTLPAIFAAAVILAVAGVLACRAHGRRRRALRPRKSVYVAAPFAPCEGLDSVENTRRAAELAEVYHRRGFRVVCVHGDILAGVYGDDADPEQRRAGMATTLAKCAEVADAGGRLAVLLRPDGTTSTGTAEEVALYLDRRTSRGGPDWWRWNDETDAPEEVE